MNTLQYRATLNDPGNVTQERPLTIYGTERRELEEWAAKVLAKAVSPDACVCLYHTVEQQIAIITKPKRENAK